MDFGKKGDAKKAMKLMWKEGITLKQAWKRVKGKESKKKSSKSLSPKKRKTQAMAKKAMKLKWKEGITLKEAWKRVNKFGETVCPPGCKKIKMASVSKTVPYGMEINPDTGRLRKICSPPSVRNYRGRCVKPKAPVVLKPGYEINPDTRRKRKMCLPGQYRDPVSRRCRTIKDFTVTPLLADYRTMDFGNKGKKCGFGTCKVCTSR